MGKMNLTNLLLAILFISISVIACSKDDFIDEGPDKEGQGPITDGDYYVAPWGNDANSGSFEQPWGTWQKAFESAKPGDIVYFRGGVWYPTSTYPGRSGVVYINPYDSPAVGHDGTAKDPISLIAYPGETPVLDCGKVEVPVNFLNGIELNRANFWIIKGLTIQNVCQSKESTVHGFITGDCSNLTVENLTVKNIGGKGIVNYSYFQYEDVPEQANILGDTIKYINCDASYCMDSKGRQVGSTDFGNYSDGFWINVQNPASYVLIQGCRSWMNSDDGYDLPTVGVIDMINCWAFNNGHLDAGQGQGIRNDPSRNIDKPWTISNCISAFNKYAGFTVGKNGGNNQAINFYNNFSYNNEYGIIISGNSGSPQPEKYYNNIFYNNSTFDLLLTDASITQANNFWGNKVEDLNLGFDELIANQKIIVNDNDFVTLDASLLGNPREKDGSLPKVLFGHLDENSYLINAGSNLTGLPYFGLAPDIGAFESK